ncbi:hypothetical protein N7V53_18330 [Kosakonia sp. HypNH10]|jgi:hypothetical protein|uniref:hypothetical protein n=1 Tax=Kosakonia sp. HypNH10 TaxID=2980101 RepID=UPI0024498B81|nr:hypothetical protein [Kosakonia sp. HypNH10]MDH2914463.1 hypothetical protein [Kosakonia sp. HypNH10]
MDSGEVDNEKILELIGSIARRLLSQKGIVRKDNLINALEFLSKSTSEPRVRENSIRAIKMLSDREH